MTVRAESIWTEPELKGNGCEGTSYTTQNGNTLSILFSQFLINMPMGDPGGDGLQTKKICAVKVKLNPPDGMLLSGFRQLFTGGIIKSKQAVMRLEITYRMGGHEKSQSMKWERSEKIGPENPESVFSQYFDEDMPVKPKCKEKQQYTLRMELHGKRKDRVDFLVGGLDSVDTEAVPAIKVLPVWKQCVEKNRRGEG